MVCAGMEYMFFATDEQLNCCSTNNIRSVITLRVNCIAPIQMISLYLKQNVHNRMHVSLIRLYCLMLPTFYGNISNKLQHRIKREISYSVLQFDDIFLSALATTDEKYIAFEV